MNAKGGFQPSFAWRSILSARDTVNLGGYWRIGDGKSMRIWKDKWQPDMKRISSRSPTCSLSEDVVVSELIDMDTRQWKRDLIFMCFDREEAQKIVSIPLSFRLPMDSLVWFWEKDGLYSVRSAYHFLCDEKAASTGTLASCLRRARFGRKFGVLRYQIKLGIFCGD
jgi:hypothetical protein